MAEMSAARTSPPSSSSSSSSSPSAYRFDPMSVLPLSLYRLVAVVLARLDEAA